MSQPETSDPPDSSSRRSLFKRLGAVLIGGGLVAAYGTLAAFFARFLFPARPDRRGWLFVRRIDEFEPGEAFTYRLPNGAPVSISQQGDELVALSSTCPHLGCQVHWEAQNNRFFCPCHNGVFRPDGKAIAGPPADADQSLDRYPLENRKGLLFIRVPLDSLASKTLSRRRGTA
ncbi:MAG: Rieske (2Fe-2S) protein [Acidobacteriota bacterium]